LVVVAPPGIVGLNSNTELEVVSNVTFLIEPGISRPQLAEVAL
jgi:hypothetical protein